MARFCSVEMWLAALDRLLERLQAEKFPFSRVTAISASAQQHGSVYWRAGAAAVLAALDAKHGMAGQLAPALAQSESPVRNPGLCCALVAVAGWVAKIAAHHHAERAQCN